MNAVVRALTKEMELVGKEIASLQHLIYEDRPEMDMLQLHEEFRELLDRFPPDRRCEIAFVRLLEPLRRRESEIRKRIRKMMKFDANAATERLVALQFDLRDLSSELRRHSRS